MPSNTSCTCWCVALYGRTCESSKLPRTKSPLVALIATSCTSLTAALNVGSEPKSDGSEPAVKCHHGDNAAAWETPIAAPATIVSDTHIAKSLIRRATLIVHPASQSSYPPCACLLPP